MQNWNPLAQVGSCKFKFSPCRLGKPCKRSAQRNTQPFPTRPGHRWPRSKGRGLVRCCIHKAPRYDHGQRHEFPKLPAFGSGRMGRGLQLQSGRKLQSGGDNHRNCRRVRLQQAIHVLWRDSLWKLCNDLIDVLRPAPHDPLPAWQQQMQSKFKCHSWHIFREDVVPQPCRGICRQDVDKKVDHPILDDHGKEVHILFCESHCQFFTHMSHHAAQFRRGALKRLEHLHAVHMEHLFLGLWVKNRGDKSWWHPCTTHTSFSNRKPFVSIHI